MKSAFRRLLTAAGVGVLITSTTPVSAQMSPAQMKAQRDRAAQAAAKRAEAAKLANTLQYQGSLCRCGAG